MNGQTWSETPVTFNCEGSELLGILHEPVSAAHTCGVLIVVGGPQYRVGSHRQFVTLARGLAAAGFPVFRFDYRGMGDSEGLLRGFESIHEDIAAAITAFTDAQPFMREVALWGLCDAASAVAIYSTCDSRVSRLIMVNPWIRTESGEAHARVKYYYLQRIRDKEFWKKLLRLRWNPIRSISDLIVFLTRLRRPSDSESGSSLTGNLPMRVFNALNIFTGPTLVITSENDLTAKEFEDTVESTSYWKQWYNRKSVSWEQIKDADHTFSSELLQDKLELATIDWLQQRI